MNMKIDDAELEQKSIRLYPEIWTIIDKMCFRYNERWTNRSHFIRCAVVYYFNKLEKEGYEIKK